MKQVVGLIIFTFAVIVVFGQEAPGNYPGVEPEYNFLNWVKANIGLVVTLVLTIIEFVVRITPTDKDNTIFGTIKRWLDVIIPNRATVDADDAEITPKGLRVHK